MRDYISQLTDPHTHIRTSDRALRDPGGLMAAGMGQSVFEVTNSGLREVDIATHSLLHDACLIYALFVYLVGLAGASRRISCVCRTRQASIKEKSWGEGRGEDIFV